MSTPPPGVQDRRRHHEVRAIFDQAYEIALPYLDPDMGIQGQPLTRHVSVVLHERFPHLSDQDRMVLVVALQATFKVRSGNKWR